MSDQKQFASTTPNEGYSLALHGGAGTLDQSMLDDEAREALHLALRQALRSGEHVLAADGAATKAVEAVVVELENSPHFNAGLGACLTWDGEHELDAAIMDGADLRCGAVAGVRHVRNPIRAARAVMDQSDHVFLGGPGADQFAAHCGLPSVENAYYSTSMRRRHWSAMHEASDAKGRDRDPFRFGTVGAVARDRHGNVAAATSTGGMTNKRWGRIGDSPVIGAGTLADNCCCAVSCSGEGELFIRHNVAHEIAARMRLSGQALASAIADLLAGPLASTNGTGGIIAVDKQGRVVLDFNTRGMYRAWRQEHDCDHVAIEQTIVRYD